MEFLKRILNTKKIKKAKNFAKDAADKVGDKLDISEKIDDLKDKAEDMVSEVKEKINDVDEKFDVSEKLSSAKDTISATADKIADKAEAVLDDKITFDDYMKVEMKIGEIKKAEAVKGSDKLLKLEVAFGEDIRQVVSGISKSYSPEDVVGKSAVFTTNLIPRKIFGLESEAMILGVEGSEGFSMLSPEKGKVKSGSSIG